MLALGAAPSVYTPSRGWQSLMALSHIWLRSGRAHDLAAAASLLVTARHTARE